jgi:imidazolonepropionase-like amidohydrolase
MKEAMGMRKSCLTFVLALAAAPTVFSNAAWAQGGQETLALVHINVVDMQTGAVRTDQTVVVTDGRIAAVGASGEVKVPQSARQVASSGMFVMPGLWDMHVHLVFGDWFPGGKQIALPLFVANGVTGVRDMGSDLEEAQEWRSEITAGKLIGPRIHTSGPMLDGPKPRFPSSVAVATPEDGRRAVDDLKRRGADFIKLQSLIPREAVFAIADEAKKKGISFEGHVPDAMRAKEMSEAGMKSFEHLIGIFEGSSPAEDEFLKDGKTEGRFLATYDAARAERLAAQLAKNHTWQCPTLVWERGGNLVDATDYSLDERAKYVPEPWKAVTWKRFRQEITSGYGNDDLATRKRFIAKELEVVGMMKSKGVEFLAGTDTPAGVYVFPGFSLHEELERFVAAGFSPLEALRTATVNAARFFGEEAQLGTVEAGKAADLVVVRANPLADIKNTRAIEAVVLNGRYFSRNDLDKMLEGAETAAKTPGPKDSGTN